MGILLEIAFRVREKRGGGKRLVMVMVWARGISMAGTGGRVGVLDCAEEGESAAGFL